MKAICLQKAVVIVTYVLCLPICTGGDRVSRNAGGGGGGFPYPGVPPYEGAMFGNQAPMYYPPPYNPGAVFFHQQSVPISENIRAQIDYYFSNENLVKDIFLRNQVKM